jgi:hypothetical protein
MLIELFTLSCIFFMRYRVVIGVKKNIPKAFAHKGFPPTFAAPISSFEIPGNRE